MTRTGSRSLGIPGLLPAVPRYVPLFLAVLTHLLLAFIFGRILGAAPLDPPFLLAHLGLTFPLVHHERIQHLRVSFASHGMVSLESNIGLLADRGKLRYKVPNSQPIIEISQSIYLE